MHSVTCVLLMITRTETNIFSWTNCKLYCLKYYSEFGKKVTLGIYWIKSTSVFGAKLRTCASLKAAIRLFNQLTGRHRFVHSGVHRESFKRLFSQGKDIWIFLKVIKSELYTLHTNSLMLFSTTCPFCSFSEVINDQFTLVSRMPRTNRSSL